MPVGTEIARLKRAVDELAQGVAADLRSKTGLPQSDRRAIRTDLEKCMQKLDELRTLLAG